MKDIAMDIVKRASEGDMGAFEQIYRHCSGLVYGTAMRITRNRSEAQEVTQEVFLKIYKNLKAFRAKSSFTTWVYRIAVNSAINATRKTSREMARRANRDPGSGVGSVSAAVGDMADKEDNEARIGALLGALNPDQRACVVLREIEGLSYKEISGALGVNINTVRTRLKRARAALMALAKKG